MSELPMLEPVTSESEATSVFSRRSLDDIYGEIRDVYQQDDRPWIIGYSGGKDSTTALQLIWIALRELPADQRSKPVYVITSDTLVETPVIVDYIDTTLARINASAKAQGLPFQATTVSPLLADSYWVNLLGKGYPAPSSRFRWCTERLKILPANRFIIDRVSEFGEVIVVLGVRRGESATRDQVMSLHRIPGQLLSRHSTLPNAFVYTPVEEFTVEDVWTYLLQVDSPWGNDNQDLLDLYRSAQDGECPLVIDKTTASCGNSRFGCWVCTVVTKDHSMENLIESGDEWLLPLLEFRDLLAETQRPERKLEFREHRRMDGRVYFITDKDGQDKLDENKNRLIAAGPYTLDTCRDFLRRVLEIHVHVKKHGPDPDVEVINRQELREIRRIWRVERQDWADSLPEIYEGVMGHGLTWAEDDSGTFGAEERRLLEEACARHGAPAELVASLLDLERNLMGMNRRSSIYAGIQKLLSRDWRSREEVLRSLEPGREREAQG